MFKEIPENLLKQWDYKRNGDIKPADFSMAGSGVNTSTKVWWICEKGHSYYTTIGSRLTGTECPYCKNRKPLGGFNDLGTIYPGVAALWDYTRNGNLKPSQVLPGSRKKVWWFNPETGETKYRSVASVTRYLVKSGENKIRKARPERALFNTYPKIAAEWDYNKNDPDLSPQEIACGSTKKVWWICPVGHSFQAPVFRRCRQNNTTTRGCPFCAGKEVLPGFNDLKTKYPEIAAQWDLFRNYPETPDHILSGINTLYWWRCGKGHTWQASPNTRTNMKEQCPFCSGQKISFENSIAAKFPFLIMREWDFRNSEDPKTLPAESNKIVNWVCPKCGYVYRIAVAYKIKGYGLCPKCRECQ